MSGHNKCTQIKRQKAKTDGQKSKIYSKHARLISLESKKVNGNLASTSLLSVIDSAKKENVPKDVIDRAVKKGTEAGMENLESIVYESYGPGGCALIIEALTGNRNKAAQEVKHILSEHGFELASQGSALWAFRKEGQKFIPSTGMDLSDADLESLDKLVTELEENDEVQNVYTNVE